MCRRVVQISVLAGPGQHNTATLSWRNSVPYEHSGSTLMFETCLFPPFCISFLLPHKYLLIFMYQHFFMVSPIGQISRIYTHQNRETASWRAERGRIWRNARCVWERWPTQRSSWWTWPTSWFLQLSVGPLKSVTEAPSKLSRLIEPVNMPLNADWGKQPWLSTKVQPITASACLYLR